MPSTMWLIGGWVNFGVSRAGWGQSGAHVPVGFLIELVFWLAFARLAGEPCMPTEPERYLLVHVKPARPLQSRTARHERESCEETKYLDGLRNYGDLSG